MNTPNILKGHLYPSTRMARCPHFHPCVVSKKCQSFDQHNATCCFCEQRVPAVHLGGYLAEGEYMPDLQHAIVLIQERMGIALTHPDSEGQRINPHVEALDHAKWVKAKEMVANFMKHKCELSDTVNTALLQGRKDEVGRL